MNNTQKALINQDVCEQTTPNLGITQSSGLEGQIVFSGGVYVGKHSSQATSVRAGNPNKTQRSGFVWERKGEGAE